ncbi:MAG: insulinase family protein [Candidatus Daviesbacteria bacterium]|nr:MAG: insulinase family protein [Candidatus Daviesbacteria bacterium]
MYQMQTLKNGLTLITIPIPSLDSVTTLLSVGAGSRYETPKINGISHFLEHMFFKGSRKFPSAEAIANLVDGIGAVNNAATSKEYTFYWIKSAAKHLELSVEIIASMLSEPLFQEEEIEREKGVIVEEIRMYKDNPQAYVFDLYERLQFGDQPLGWEIAGSERVINSIARQNFLDYTKSLYAPKNMALVFAGKIPKNIKQISERYFTDLPEHLSQKPLPFKKIKQTKPKLGLMYKKTDQANLILGVEGFDRYDQKRYASKVLGAILGEGMSSRLFLQVRERRGLAYRINASPDFYLDTGTFVVYAGLKLEKVEEGLEVIIAELLRVTRELVTEEELKKAKELIRGRLAIRGESTNFLAEYFGVDFVLDHKLETFEEHLRKIDQVSAAEVKKVAAELFAPNRFNLQIIGPFRDANKFAKIL